MIKNVHFDVDIYTCQMMKRLDENKKYTSEALKKIIDALANKEDLEEYVGAKLYYLCDLIPHVQINQQDNQVIHLQLLLFLKF